MRKLDDFDNIGTDDGVTKPQIIKAVKRNKLPILIVVGILLIGLAIAVA